MLHPTAVIDAMLEGELSPWRALEALERTLSAAAVDAVIEAIPEATRRAVCEAGYSPWGALVTALDFGVVTDSMRDRLRDNSAADASQKFWDAVDPTRRSLPLRALLASSSRDEFLRSLVRDDALARWQQSFSWLRAQDTTRFVLGLLGESSDDVLAAMFEEPRLVAFDGSSSSLDLRESYVLLCSHFGHAALVERPFRALIERPARRTFDRFEVSVAPHETTTRAVVERATPEARMALEQWVFSVLERRESAANEWIALAQWCSSERAAECFARAMSIIERREEPFEAALLPRALQERLWPISERRVRAWFDRRARLGREEDGRGIEDHFRCRWFSPDNAHAVRLAAPLFERGVVAIGRTFGATVSAWLDEAEARFDPAIDEALDEHDPLRATLGPLARLEGVRWSLWEVFEPAALAHRERWIDALIDRCPSMYESVWRWANERQRDRMLALVRRCARARDAVSRRWYANPETLPLVAASMDAWVRLGCPLSRDASPDLVAIRRHFEGGRRDPARNAWQLDARALRERLATQLAERSLDWVRDPGSVWIGAMLGDDPGSRALLTALYEQVVASDERESIVIEPHPLAPPDEQEPPAGVDASAEPTPSNPWPQWVLFERLAVVEHDDGLRAIRDAVANNEIRDGWTLLPWLARVAPDRVTVIGDRLIALIVEHHATEELVATRQ
ncbi:MAG: hypothetical protein JNK05_25140 [Myxococcales bacterium]|nr:hypothetical protein [Myxococcales bacterium]